MSDFRCDVDLAVRAVLKNVSESDFRRAYLEFDSDDEIEQTRYAIGVLGGRHWSVVQRVGAAFIKRSIYPLGGNRGYFHSIRHVLSGWIGGASVQPKFIAKTPRDEGYEQCMAIFKAPSVSETEAA